ncbi:ABC-type polysaccharide/polyol phosphate transport system, ATPase component [Chryseobacterium ureilyticum]|uniref:ABC-type polysaccharide/polyol phosphate transport system, ATPase component n=1 Tax=Chryseobacterium ureilyticum TaxID=373668 RepID=A0A1N7NEX2_9FLAO|nr:polysaccharide ABC transporter ATP-binding protein [Chryseobacterium ureilyticum]SIS96801.1 ABC-type polysaccharide/polyol phosphate transport system, ATPase component [Chryseobacterium ureilyticum]
MLALKAENISKQYRLGEVGTGTLSHDLNRFWHKVRGKEDPYLKIGEANDRTSKGDSEYVWSLRDINFEIQQGDAVGIIGRNGAGKSTLLKLLSKVTKPTTGQIYTNGRIASLLEVGTGFHPEMTGRENVFLNGAILGMTRKEIKRKFDEIVDFSGVERYIDTPVKRYSSGMYVRLAFAVAAHLESEILIVDEVLAVGDADFQKKCLGKMGDVTKGEGRTILFVSHNMTAVKELCTKGILLNQGLIDYQGSMLNTIIEYQKNSAAITQYHYNGNIEEALGNDKIRIKEFSVSALNGKLIDIDSGIKVKLVFHNNCPNINLDTTFELRNYEELTIFHVGKIITKNQDSRKGVYSVEFNIPPGLLNAGNYYFKLFFGKDQSEALFILDNFIGFEVENVKVGSKLHLYPGITRPHFDYTIQIPSQIDENE